MAKRSSSQRLILWLNGTPVGYWDASPQQNSLTYFDDWLTDGQGRPVSLSLPFRPDNKPYRGHLVQNYFDNLLPDSQAIRRRMATHFRCDGIEPYQLLAAVGRDCVGAIQLLPPDEEPTDIFSIRGAPLNESQVAAILRNAVADQPLGQRSEDVDLRLSIAGAQEKSALLRHDGQWLKPVGSTPTTYILKLPMGLVGAMQADMRTSVENEWLCSKLIQAFGLPIANCEIATFEDMKTLVVERFDRRRSEDGTWIVRLPQEDFCQAAGVSPLHKYQADGGPGISAIMEILLASDQAQMDRVNFFKTQIIFWLLAATDGHAKNFSIFHLPRSRFVATPVYDVLSAHPILGTGKNELARQRAKLAMAVRGSQNDYHIDQIRRRHWIHHARLAGLGETTAESIIEDVLDRADEAVRAVSQIIPDEFPEDIADAILQGVLAQCDRLRNMEAAL